MSETQAKTWGEAADAGQPITEVFGLLMELAQQEGRIPFGFWQFDMPGDWRVTVNGSDGDRNVHGVTVKRFHVLVERNGWPVMVVTPFYGDVLGSPDPAGMTPAKMEAALVAALRERLSSPVG